MNSLTLNEKWIKASIIGTIWAAFEIVLGSFFHNLRIPFSSNVLTGIGIIILISISHKWTEKGLFWRAGLICALMKTISPSAVIFGPMIAIFSEALLLELSVRLFGRTLVGYLFGGMLAMSWNLFHMVMNYLLLYGFNIIKIYTSLLEFTQKQLNLHFDIVWLPILLLLVLYCLMGLVSAIIGIKVGRKLVNQPLQFKAAEAAKIKKENKVVSNFPYSLLWLFANIILLIGGLFLLKERWEYWTVGITALVIVWALRYKRAFRQLSKPKFWLLFIFITMLTAFVFTQLQGKSWTDGFLIGIQMNFRAILIITGFSVLGTELFNPKIRSFFQKTYCRQLPLALELSFESLPLMVAHIPDFKTILKNPVSVIYHIISQAEYRLAQIQQQASQKVFIVSGAVGQGKTTQIIKLIESCKAKNITVGGIYSPRILENDTTIGYDIIAIETNERAEFLRITDNEQLKKIGRFSILPEGLKLGEKALLSAKNKHFKIIFIDEIGRLELDNHGWANSFELLLNLPETYLVLAVRDSFIEQVIQKWNLRNYTILNLAENDSQTVTDLFLKQIQ